VGESWVRLTRSDDQEDIKIDATMFDDSAPASRSGDPSQSPDSTLRFHITVAVEVSRKGSRSGAITMQFLCSAWPDAMDVRRVSAAPSGIHAIKPYLGPHFK
jgi:complement component 1 Q subcomponent-binding protein, mitochondrial